MPRGDVLLAQRRIGLQPGTGEERFVVLQDDKLTAMLSTSIVAPLLVADETLERFALNVPVSAREAGAEHRHVLVPTQIGAVPTDRFAPGAVGRLAPETLERVDGLLQVILALP